MKMNPKEFHFTVKGRAKDIETKLKSDWEIARVISHSAVSPYLDHSKGQVTPEKFLPFEWDKKKVEKAEKISKEELINLEKRWKVNK